MDENEIIGLHEARKDVAGFITVPHIIGITLGLFAFSMFFML